MDRDDLELFAKSVEAAVASADVDAALAELGWEEAYEAEPQAAVAVLFDALGRAGATSSAIHRVVGPTLPAGLAFGRGEPIAGIDPMLGLGRVDGNTALTDEQVRLGRLALSHQLLGASRRMLDLAREHALEREQFGQKIAGFQAIRHRLADTLVAIEVAEAVVDEAWADGSPDTAAMAKALAGRGARTAARHCQQVLAGIGFTTEHDLHRYVRRVFVLDELLGASRALTIDLGTHLLTTRQLPPQRPL
jgi:alkylation response protein AidB-like acyl-CoA dehydrogenase